MKLNDLGLYKFNKELVSRTIGEVLMVYNPESGETMEINDVGKDIFFLLQAENSMKNILETLSVDYQVEIADIEKDVEEFVERMIILGVVLLDE